MAVRYKRSLKVEGGPIPSGSTQWTKKINGVGNYGLARSSDTSPGGSDSWRWATSPGMIPLPPFVVPGVCEGDIIYRLDISGIQSAYQILLRSVKLWSKNAIPFGGFVRADEVAVRKTTEFTDSSGVQFAPQPETGTDWTYRTYGNEATPVLDLTGTNTWYAIFRAQLGNPTPFTETVHWKSGPELTLDIYVNVQLVITAKDQNGNTLKGFTCEVYESDQLTLVATVADDDGNGVINTVLQAGRYFLKGISGTDVGEFVEADCSDDTTVKDLIITKGIPPEQRAKFSALVTSDNIPVEGATVSLSTTGGTIYSQRTNNAGITATATIPKGNYTLICAKDGFKNTTQSITLTQDDLLHPVVLTKIIPPPPPNNWLIPVVIAGTAGIGIVALLYFKKGKRRGT